MPGKHFVSSSSIGEARHFNIPNYPHPHSTFFTKATLRRARAYWAGRRWDRGAEGKCNHATHPPPPLHTGAGGVHGEHRNLMPALYKYCKDWYDHVGKLLCTPERKRVTRIWFYYSQHAVCLLLETSDANCLRVVISLCSFCVGNQQLRFLYLKNKFLHQQLLQYIRGEWWSRASSIRAALLPWWDLSEWESSARKGEIRQWASTPLSRDPLSARHCWAKKSIARETKSNHIQASTPWGNNGKRETLLRLFCQPYSFIWGISSLNIPVHFGEQRQSQGRLILH